MQKINRKKKTEEHPSIKAIEILEFIAGRLADKGLAKEKIFDGELWYELEDGVMKIINKK